MSSRPASTDGQETGLTCLSGSATVKAGSPPVDLGQYDAIYIPRDTLIEARTATEIDLAEFSADVERPYPLQAIRYADVAKDSSLKFTLTPALFVWSTPL